MLNMFLYYTCPIMFHLQFQWLAYFQATLSRDDLNISVNSSTPVINRNPDYMEKIVNKLNTENKRYTKESLKNYEL